MSQPPTYNRQASFANLQALNPSGQPPGNTMDAEYNAIKTTLDATLTNLALIQNDDGTVAHASIGVAQLAPSLVLGFSPPSAWVTGHSYTASPASTVLHGTGMYVCLVSHTSSAFASDLALGKWLLIFDLSTLTFGAASQIAVVSHGSNVTSDVQTSLNNLDDNKAAISHTHTASQISDSSAAGRAMLTAANVAAQQTLLGLGALAFLSAAPATTVIPGQIAFTGSVGSGSLGSNQNDFTPTGWATNAVLRLTSSTGVTITGFGATTDGDIKFVQNVGGFIITLIGNDASSAAANRMALARPVLLSPGQSIVLQYDGANTIWRLLSQSNTNPPVGSFKNIRVGNVANALGDSAPLTPNNQVYINFDELVLEDGAANAWWVTGGTLQADATVVGANGIDAGALGASAWYSVWAIGDALTGSLAALVSTSATAPTLPAGYAFKARVGWMRTDGSSHFLKILQYGRTARYTGTMPQIASGAGTYASGVAVANFVPSTAVKIVVTAAGAIGAAGNLLVGAGASTSPTAINIANGTGGGTISANSTVELTLEGANIFYGASTAGGGSPSLSCYGWEDS